MPLANYTEYIDKLSENRTADFQMSNNLGRSTRLSAVWPRFLPAPNIPTTSVALDKNAAESIGPIPAISTGILTLLGARLATGAGAGAGLMVLDLLNVSGGLDGTLTTPQTTNLPTATLTRYTNGEGVMIGIIIHAAMGTTATTLTVSYTNQAGVSGRISTPTSFGATGFREAFILIPIPLQAGDTGVRSVGSVTLAGTTGTAGNFGVCLFKPLAMISMESTTGSMPLDAVSSGGMINSLCEIHSDACLSLAAISNLSQSISGSLILGEV